MIRHWIGGKYLAIFSTWINSNSCYPCGRYSRWSVSSYARKYQFSIYITCLILSLGIAGPLIQATYYADNFAVVDASIRQVGNFLDEQELVRPSKEVLLTDDGFHFEHVSFGYDKKKCCMI